MWENLNTVGESITLNNEEDQILWSYSSSEKYYVQSLYAIINHGGCNTSGVKHALSISNHAHEHHLAFIITCDIRVTLN
jgi:uncharacterized protein (UPF0333 family)